MKIHRTLFLLCCFITIHCSLFAKKTTVQSTPEPVTPEMIKFNYYFFDAVREQLAKHYDVALDLLQQCDRMKPNNASVMFELAKLYAQVDKNDTSTLFLEKAVAADPDNIWYRQFLAEHYLSAQKVEKAIDCYKAMLTLDPRNETAQMMLVNIYTQTGQLQDAINVLDDMERTQGMNKDITVEKARLYFMMKQNKKGGEEIDNLIKTYPNDLKYQVIRGDLYLEQKEKKEALKAYNDVLKEDPNQGDALYSLAKYYLADNDTATMIHILDKMIRNKEIGLDDKLAVMRDLAVNRSGGDKIKHLLSVLLEMYPNEESVHDFNYRFLMSRQDTVAANKEVQTLLDLNPQNKMTWMILVNQSVQKGKFVQVDSLCNQAISYFPDDPDFYFFKAIALYQLEKFRETVDVCKIAISQTPEQNPTMLSQLYTQLGDAYYRLNEKDSTFMSYEQALQYQPNNIGTLNNYAYYLSLEKRDLLKAENMSAKTVQADPSNATYLDTYAWIFFVEGNYSLAKIYIQQAISNGGDKNPDVLEHYGDILFFTGNIDDAVKWWKKAVEAGNKSETLKKKIDEQKYDVDE